MHQKVLSIFCAASLVACVGVACSKSKALTPTTPTVSPVTPPGGATLKATAPTPQSPVNDVRLETFGGATLRSSGSSPTGEGVSFTPQYRFQLLNDAGGVVQDSGLQNSTSWTPTAQLDFDKRYQWQVRAEYNGDAGPWSARATFLSPNGGFIRGKEVYDPLTNGRSVGLVVGGHFVTGPDGGWQADGLDHAIDYDIATCDACRVEFDATNFGNGEGASISVDVKWFSMGDRGSWGGFGPFRDHPWKMHLEQRSDGDGSGMQLIWRNGAADADSGGDPDYGDHRGKYTCCGPAWGHSYDNKVWHFVIEWTRTTYKVAIGENGGTPKVWFPGGGSSGYFANNHPYAPPNHRIELGCRARGESMIGARYRNFRVTPL